MENRFYRVLIGFVCLVLLFPLIQQISGVIKVKPLEGYIVKEEQPKFSWLNWLDESYQKQLNRYVKQNYGLQPSFVRASNQVQYSLFGNLRARGVLFGKENYLYEENYIKAITGSDFIGDSLIADKVYKLQKITDTLNSLHKKIVVVFAPGKGSFYPEKIPKKYTTKSVTNYKRYTDYMLKNKLNFIDANRWFRDNKGKKEAPLFPQTGVHWSKYGEHLMADSLISYLESLCNVNLPNLILDSLKYQDKKPKDDTDIENGLNLVFSLNSYQTPHVYSHFEALDSLAPRIKGLVVADSYYWGMFNKLFSHNVLGNGQFWYYNEVIYPDAYKEMIKVKDVNLKTEVEKNDVIILMYTDANLPVFANGFINDLYKVYYQ